MSCTLCTIGVDSRGILKPLRARLFMLLCLGVVGGRGVGHIFGFGLFGVGFEGDGYGMRSHGGFAVWADGACEMSSERLRSSAPISCITRGLSEMSLKRPRTGVRPLPMKVPESNSSF